MVGYVSSNSRNDSISPTFSPTLRSNYSKRLFVIHGTTRQRTRRSTGRNVSFVKEDRIPSTCENREAKPLDDALNVCSLGNGFGRFDEFYRVEGTLKVGGGGGTSRCLESSNRAAI